MIISIFLRHYKAYKNIYFAPVANSHMFTAYVGNNGMGKSSILEALNTFFNGKTQIDWNINNEGKEKGLSGADKTPFIAPVFLIKKSKIIDTNLQEKLEELSNFFWKVEQSTVSKVKVEFFEQREKLRATFSPKEYYFFVIGKRYDTSSIFFTGFHNTLIKAIFPYESEEEKIAAEDKFQKKFKNLIKDIINIYAYIYIPVESNIQDTTKLETRDMQELMNKDLKELIEQTIKQETLNDINSQLSFFLDEVGRDLEIYCYETPVEKIKKNLTKPDLVRKIIEEYFTIRVLSKKVGTKKIAVENLSAGEKRQALISSAYAFLKKDGERNKIIILAIDEPEASLHTSACFDQFRKLQSISTEHQIIITTHWYGFLPVISQGIAHFLSNDEESIKFETYDLFSYRATIKQQKEKSKNSIPKDFSLKSINDLVQSVFYSLQDPKNPYNWLICEGITEKYYFEYFLKKEINNNNLVILPVGGAKSVVKIFRHLLLPLKESAENNDKNCKGRIFCLIDTDKNQPGNEISKEAPENIAIRKLYNEDNNNTKLEILNKANHYFADIEDCLNPIIFKKTLECFKSYCYLDLNIAESNNTGLRGLDIRRSEHEKLKAFFDLDDGNMKIDFAKKYIEILSNEENQENFTPDWINEIRKFFIKNDSLPKDNTKKVYEKKSIKIDLKNINENWQNFLDSITNFAVKMSLRMSNPVKYENGELHLIFNSRALMNKIEEDKSQKIIKEAFKKTFGINLVLKPKFKPTQDQLP